jgi:UDP-GlcNAc:undecaprenyl-phosphate GlcNAc-1-phosphate transferase
MPLEMLLAAALGMGLCLLLTPLARPLARGLGLVDWPDGRRKLHRRPIPVVGGPVLLIAVGVAVAVVFGRSPWLGELALAEAVPLIGLLAAAVVLCVVGMADDRRLLRGRHKVLGQLLAAGIVIAMGVQVDTVRLFNRSFDLGLLSIPFTLFLLLGAINSLNLIDGMDGLLSSVALIICLALGVLAVLSGKFIAASIAFALAGSLLGFLFFNFPPASVFLGDSGSMVIGLTVGVLAIHSCLKGPATIALAAPTALLTIPIFDTAAAILRRKLTGRSIYSTDRGHLHHSLLRRLHDPRLVLLIVSGCCLVTAGGAFASLFWHNEGLALISGLFVVAILIVTGLFGHAELELLLQRLRTAWKSLLQPPDGGHEIEVRLQGTLDWRELWKRVTACAPMLNLCHLRLDINAPAIGEGYHVRWDCGGGHDEAAALWRMQIPLAVDGRVIGEVQIAGRPDDEPMWEKIAALARMIQQFESTATLLTGGSCQAPAAPPSPVEVHVPDLLRTAPSPEVRTPASADVC